MNNKRKKSKVILAMTVIFTFFTFNITPLSVNADNRETANNKSLFTISKTAEYYHKGDKQKQLKDREYTINLNASFNGATKSNPKDVILVLDKSGSMKSNKAEDNLKEAAINFSKKLLSDKNNKISVITFSGTYENDREIKGLKKVSYNEYKGYLKYYNDNKEEVVTIHDDDSNEYYCYGYINKGLKNEKKLLLRKIYTQSLHFPQYIYIGYKVMSGIKSDSDLLVDFTSNKNYVTQKINSITSEGVTNAEAALDKVEIQLQKVKNDNRGKYVIFFTDGLPNYSLNYVGENNQNYISLNVINQTINTYKEIEKENKNTRFISLGFKSSTLGFDGYYKNMSDKFLSGIQNYNKEIEPESKNGVIYINSPNDIDKVYDKIYKKIINSIDNVTIRDVVPDNFKIVEGSVTKGGKIDGNTVTWDNQVITKQNQTFSFRIKAKDTYLGNVEANSDYMNKDGSINTNEKATIEYINPTDNKKTIEEFPIPKVNVPYLYKLSLQDKTVLYGDKIRLKDLIKDLNIPYGQENGYVYKWTDNKGKEILLDNVGKNEKLGDGFNKNDSIVMKEDTNYTLEITNKDIPSLNLKSTAKVKVIKPKVEILKNVIDSTGKSIDSDQLFSFNMSQNYNGNIPVEFTNQNWNVDIYNNEKFTINNITRGTYKFNEGDCQGYNIKSLTVDNQVISLNKDAFEIGMSDDGNVTLNGKKIGNNNPVIKINIVNESNPLKFFNSSNVIRNTFEKCK